MMSPRASARSGDLAMTRSCATCSCAPAQPGLWFIAGSFAQCRIYSKYLGLQIKACEAGLLPRVRAVPDAKRPRPVLS